MQTYSAPARAEARRLPSDVRRFYTAQSVASDPGRHAHLFDRLPAEPAALARTLQGLVIYEYLAEPFYGVKLPPERREESHLRTVEAIVDAALALDDRPLVERREPARRLVGICRHYMLLAVSALRHHGIPARSRGGFSTYFTAGQCEDHWVCEYWQPDPDAGDADHGSWKLLDAQLDEMFVRMLGVEHDLTDIPRTAFLTSPEAWRACRAGEADPAVFGFADMRGLPFVAGSLMRDLATLNKVEVLPWDVWGAQPELGTELSAAQLAFFDDLAALTADPDGEHPNVVERFGTDPSVATPSTVFNATMQRRERLPGA